MRQNVGVLGASSLVGECLLKALVESGWGVRAFSRSVQAGSQAGVEWHVLPPASPGRSQQPPEETPIWISVAPVWVLPEYFSMILAAGGRRVVALSSTSRFTKSVSRDAEENATALRLAEGEDALRRWAECNGIDYVILRPTLIYGFGRDKNIAHVARLIRRIGYFPLPGKAQGLRQPVHARDVAAACILALGSPQCINRAYNISGGETVTYREMVARVFQAVGRTPKFIIMPLFIYRLVVTCLRIFPRYRHLSVAMVERMNRDMVFDHNDAVRDLGFKPRPFNLTGQDLPN